MKLIDIINNTKNLNHENHLIGTDKNSIHSYIDGFYEENFAPYKNKKISLLEIGISSGASLFLWKKYFQKGSITGIDIIDLVTEEWRSSDIKYIFDNAYSKKFVADLPNFDIIIDDGPHDLITQMMCIDLYLPKLNKGGLLVIEDVQSLENLEILKRYAPQKYKTKIFDLSTNKKRYDDLIFVVIK